jgi:hypothetical protein
MIMIFPLQNDAFRSPAAWLVPFHLVGMLFPRLDLFTDESRGTYSRTKIVLFPGAGRPASGVRAAFLQVQNGLPPGPELNSARPERPSSSSRTGYLRGQGDLPVNGYLNRNCSGAPLLRDFSEQESPNE